MGELRIDNILNRKTKLQSNAFIILSTILVVFTLAFTKNSFFSSAKSTNGYSEIKYYTSIVVERGDTLWSIANENITIHYNDIEQYVNEVIQMNSLLNENIKAGQNLIIPYYADHPKY